MFPGRRPALFVCTVPNFRYATMKHKKYATTQADLASLMGVNRRTIADWKSQPGFPRKGVRGWSVAAVSSWRSRRDGCEDSPDPLLAGVVSPALERYRQARATLAELEVSQKRSQLVSLEAVTQGLAVFASTMRSAFDTLQRQFGQEAYAVVANALDDAESILQRAIGQPKDKGDSDANV
jgi:phage terminase Nu1 subunit (DNA packaging protein)